MAARKLVFLLAVCCATPLGAQESALVQMQNGELKYEPYANRNETVKTNTVPDFSMAGYRGGGVALPLVPVKKEISPVPGDDGKAIQAAIDSVSRLKPDANGFRGAVLLKAGVYEIAGTIYVRASGVVLRGEGNLADGGTRIVGKRPGKRILIHFTGEDRSARSDPREITTRYVPTGAFSFEVSSASGYRVGDGIMVRRTPNQAWMDALGLKNKENWTPERYGVDYERTITAISGNTITIDAPIVQSMEEQSGGGKIMKHSNPGRISEVGIENLWLDSEFSADNDENHPWQAVGFSWAVNAWARDVTARHFGYACVEISHQCRFITVQDCAHLAPKSIVTGSRRYSFVIQNHYYREPTIPGGTCILFQRCFTSEARHDYVVQALIPGPNVFLDCYATNTKDAIGPHHNFATGTLFDNIRAGGMEVRNRGTSGPKAHGWAGAQTLYWNCAAVDGGRSKLQIESPPKAMNWSIGTKATGGIAGGGHVESEGAPVLPRSLYIQQLKERLGQKALDNVLYQAQMNGSIWNQLGAWAGAGNFRPSEQK